jgi:hypothetical protein
MTSYETQKQEMHRLHVEKIRDNPKVIRLDNIVLATGESSFFHDKGLFHQTDNLLFDPSTRTLYNVEYKCSPKQSLKAKLQLMEEEDTLRQCFPNYKIVSLYVSSDYKIKTVKETM